MGTPGSIFQLKEPENDDNEIWYLDNSKSKEYFS